MIRNKKIRACFNTMKNRIEIKRRLNENISLEVVLSIQNEEKQIRILR